MEDASTTHFVYQTATVEGTLSARVLSLETIDPAARAGLMIRQDNSPESAYALLALTPQGVRFESRQGGSTKVTYVEGSSASAPVWLELERKEGRVYAYRSGNGMNWRRMASVALNTPVNFGLATGTQQGMVLTTYQNVELVSQSRAETQVPFEVDTFTVEGWSGVTVGGLFGLHTPIEGQASGTVAAILPTPEEPFMFADLLAADREGSEGYATDVLIYGVKDTLYFSAANTVRTSLLQKLKFFNLSTKEKIFAYERFQEHSKFDELARIYTDSRGMPVQEQVLERSGDLQAQIAIEVATEILEERNETSSVPDLQV